MDDSEIAGRLLGYLARKFDCADVAYAEGPSRITGGFDAAIFGFALNGAPSSLSGEPARVGMALQSRVAS